MLSIIAVIGKNRELGKDEQLLWHIPGDLPRFKQITWGHPVIMGRKTHSAFQYKGGPLPGRTNIVMTHDAVYKKEGFIIVHSLDEAVRIAGQSPGSEEAFVIGGGNVFSQTIHRADRLYVTIVDASAPADTFFPEFSEFTKVISEEHQEAGGFRFVYKTLERS